MLKLICISLILYAVAIDVRTLARTQDYVDDEVDESELIVRRQGYPSPALASGRRPAPYPRPQSQQVAQLECYTCSDCPIVQPNTTVKLCPYTSHTTKQNKCVVYSEKYKYMKKPWYIRGCASDRGSCSEIKNAHAGQDLVDLLNCNECTGDKCNSNSVPRTLPDMVMAFFVLVLTPVLAKYAMA